MKYKVICSIDKLDGKGTVEHPLFITADSENEAETLAKQYCILEKQWVLENVKSISKL